MGISLAEYRELIGGRATLAEIEARHKVQQVCEADMRRQLGLDEAKLAKDAADIGQRLEGLMADGGQAAQNVSPAAPVGLDGGWFGDLPYPPSLNHYYRHVGAKVLISAKGRRYRKMIERLVDGCPKITGKVMLRVDAYPPDLRRRDLDNLLKALQDAITHGGLLADDSDIKRLHMEMHEPKRPDGMVRVGISRISGNV